MSAKTSSISWTGTGAPAESNMDICSSAVRCAVFSSSAVSTTFRRAAGEAKTIVVSPAMAALASGLAAKVAGLVTDILGVTEVATMAGRTKQNGTSTVGGLQ